MAQSNFIYLFLIFSSMAYFSFISLIFLLFLALFPITLRAQQEDNCQANQIFNGKGCACAPGATSAQGHFLTSPSGIKFHRKISYFDKSSKDRCDAECDEEYYSPFSYGYCTSGLFSRIHDKEKTSPCSMKCVFRLRFWVIVAIFALIAAAIVTLVLLLPMCIATCASCLNSKKASKHSKRVAMEQQSQPNKDQQLATLSYNPYTYWPYYGR